MDDRVVQFRVGVMVLATAIILGILVVLFGELPAFFQGSNVLYVVFPSAPGVAVDTPVRKNGILIGRVANVEFHEEGGVLVTLSIQRSVNRSEVRIRRNEVCQIKGSLLGDATLQFVPGNDPDAPPEPVDNGELIAGVVASDPLQVITNLEGSMSQALGSVAQTSDEIGKLTRQFSDMLGNNREQINRIVTKLESTLDELSSLAGGAGELLGDPQLQEDLKITLHEFPAALREARETLGTMKEALAGVDENLDNLAELTGPLGDRGPQLVQNVEQAVERLNDVLGQVSQFTQALNAEEGSLGRLLSDPELYQQITAAVENISELSGELKPILHNARVFSDKIARHPELLGVRGALQRSSGVK